MSETLDPGLYIVATPIGNLSDLSPRAATVLAAADLIAAEDSRVTAKLLRHIGVKRPMIAYHDHVASHVRPQLVERMQREAIALVSDAGTPLISDPGYKLVRDARAAGIRITTLPGPSAPVAALTLSGLPTDRFAFFGFLPTREKARAATIAEAAAFDGTLVFFESGQRLAASLDALCAGLGDRPAAVVREISKAFEETRAEHLGRLGSHYREAGPPRGEIVIVVGPPEPAAPAGEAELDAALADAMARLTPSRAAAEVARRLNLPRRLVYERAQALKPSAEGGGE